MKIILKTAVQERRVILARGTELEMDAAAAQSLIARGVARAVLVIADEAPPAGGASVGGAPAGDASGEKTDTDQPVVLSEKEIAEWVALNRDAALAAIEKIPAEQTRILQALLEVEQANKKRVSVLEAIGLKLFPPVND